MHLICCTYPATSPNFNTNYVNFEKVESFLEKYKIIFFFQGKYGIVMNVLFVKMKISKLINYSTNMCWSCQGAMVFSNWPLWNQKIWYRGKITKCCHALQVSQLEARSEFLQQFQAQNAHLHWTSTYMPHDFCMHETNLRGSGNRVCN
jgi:hypothetical protein